MFELELEKFKPHELFIFSNLSLISTLAAGLLISDKRSFDVNLTSGAGPSESGGKGVGAEALRGDNGKNGAMSEILHYYSYIIPTSLFYFINGLCIKFYEP